MILIKDVICYDFFNNQKKQADAKSTSIIEFCAMSGNSHSKVDREFVGRKHMLK